MIDADGDLVTPLVNRHERILFLQMRKAILFVPLKNIGRRNMLEQKTPHSCTAGTFLIQTVLENPFSWLYPMRSSSF